MKIHSVLLFLIFILCFDAVEAQTNSSNKSETETQEKIPVENIYVQTDKDIYKRSEIIWFKAHILNTFTLKPSLINSTLFVLLKEKQTDEIVFKEKYKIVNGFVNGDIFLDEKLKAGEYYVSAFTSSSINHNSKSITSFKTVILKDDSAKILLDYTFDKDAYKVNSELNVELNFYDAKGMDFFNRKVLVEHFRNDKRLERNSYTTNERGVIKLNLDQSYVDPKIKTTIKLPEGKRYDLKIPFENDKDIRLRFFPEGGKLVYGVINKVAFKATDLLGKPVSVNAELFSNGTRLFSFRSFHEGMGYFNFVPELGNIYDVRLEQPKNVIFQLPKIHKTGYTIFVSRNTDDFLKVNISKSKNIQNSNIMVALQSKGNRYWESKIKMTKDIVSLRIPKKNLPNDMMEFTLYTQDRLPIAERLIFLNTDKELQIKNLSSLEPIYQNKQKIVLKLKTENAKNNSIVSHLGLRVYDNALHKAEYITDIQSHYYLLSNLKGKISNPRYYFHSKNKHRLEHLDLLLLTHGWRNYVYSNNNLNTIRTNGKITIEDDCAINIYEFNNDGKLDNLKEPTQIDLVYPNDIIQTKVQPGEQLIVPLVENEFTFVKTPQSRRFFIQENNPFDKIGKITSDKNYQEFVAVFDQNKTTFRNQLRDYYTKNSQSLDLVVVKTSKNRHGFSDQNKRKWVYPGEGDYVCKQFNIFNCVNHTLGGYEPIEGKTYFTNSGEQKVYRKKKFVDLNERKKKGFYFLKGYKIKKEFFSPDYEKEPSSVFDMRTTLAWQPNITTDENGFATVSFYTSEINSSFTIHIEGVDDDGNIGSKFFNFRVKPGSE